MSDRETAPATRRSSLNLSLSRKPWLRGLSLAGLLILSSCGDERADPNTLGLNAPSDMSLITGSVHQGLQRNGIFIQLPAGLPDELASQLLARFQEASIANQLTLARTGTVPEYTVKGIARAGATRDGTAVVLVWEVIGPDGKRVKRMTDDVLIQRRNSAAPSRHDPWAVVDEATLEEIADTAALELASWVSDQTLGASPDSEIAFTTASIDLPGGQNAGASPMVDFSTPSLLQPDPSSPPASGLSGIAARNATLGLSSPVAALAPVTPSAQQQPAPATEETAVHTDHPLQPIALESVSDQRAETSIADSFSRPLFDVAVGISPGDGRLSLAAAVQEALVNAQIKGAEPQAYRVIGNVALTRETPDAAPGTINVSIEWTVATKDGTALGLVTQSNQVAENALAGTWGDIAVAAGSAAADGILQLIKEPTPPA